MLIASLRRRAPTVAALSAAAAALLVLALPGVPTAGPAPAPAGLAAQILPRTGGDPAQDPEDAAPADSTIAVPADRAAADRAAAEQLQALFERMAGFETVAVRVDAGLARLTGTVSAPETRERAGEIARRVEGIAFVDNRLEVSASIEERLAPAWQRVRGRMVDLLVYLPLLGAALLVVLLAVLAAVLLGRVEPFFRRLSDNVFVRNVLRQAIRTVIVLVGVIVAVEILGLTALVGAVVGTAGLAGLILGFAFKDIVENYLAGLILSLRQPFLPNDIVLIEEQEGKVVRLTSRETILMSLAGNHIRIPNATVFRSVVVNYTRNPRRQFQLPFSVSPLADIAEALETGVQVLRAMPGVLNDPTPFGRVTDVGDSLVNLAFFGWVDQAEADFLKVRSEATRLVLEGLIAADVDMPPPEQRLRIMREADAHRPRKPRQPGSDAPLDVSPDRHLDEQIEEDRRTSSEEDLLSPREPNPDPGALPVMGRPPSDPRR